MLEAAGRQLRGTQSGWPRRRCRRPPRAGCRMLLPIPGLCRTLRHTKHTCLAANNMLRALAAQQAAPQLLAAVRAGACGALASGVLRRGLAAMVEPTAFPPADRDSFHYAVLQAPLMKAGAVCVVAPSSMRPKHTCCPACLARCWPE